MARIPLIWRDGQPLGVAFRLGVVILTGAALVLLVGYLLLFDHRAALTLRQNLLDQRVQQTHAEAVALEYLLASAGDDLRHLAESREVSALDERRVLGAGPEELRLGQDLVRERFLALLEPSGAVLPKLGRIALFDQEGALVTEASTEPGAVSTAEARGAARPGLVRIGADGRALLVAWPRRVHGKEAGRLVASIRPDAILRALAASGTPNPTAVLVLDGDGRAYRPGASAPAPALALPVLGSLPPGRTTELRGAQEARGGARRYLAVREPIPGQGLSLVRIDLATSYLAEASPAFSALSLAAAAAALMAILVLAVYHTVKSLVLRARLRESLRREHEVGEKHRALEREMAERQRLESAHGLLARAVEQASEAIALTEACGAVDYANPAFERLAGEAVRGRPVAEAFRAHSEPEAVESLSRALGENRPWRGELSVRRGEHDLLQLEVVTSPVQDLAGTTVNQVLVARDITEENRLRDQLRHAQKLEAIGTLAGGVAHDFNNLLTAVKANAEFALEALTPGDSVRADVEEIHKAASRAAALTQQLLAFSRRQVLKPEVLDLNQVVTGVENMLSRLIGEDIEIVTELEPQLPLVLADPGQLQQVLVNLVVNARDAMPKGGRLTIGSSACELGADGAREHGAAPGRYVRLSVKDSGTGMDDATRARIFEPFFTTKGPGRGTGLGLATVYGIVRQSRGFLEVRSSPGQGSTFEIYLPVGEGFPAPSPRPADTSEAIRSGRGERVLLVEDERAVRAAIERRLRAEGYLVLSAANGREALELAERDPGRIDVLLSDVVMPHLSGPELAQRFRERHPEALVVFMSGYSEEAVARHGDLAEAFAYVQKPDGLPKLARTLRAGLDRPRRGAP